MARSVPRSLTSYTNGEKRLIKKLSVSKTVLASPRTYYEALPASSGVSHFVQQTRSAIRALLNGADQQRLLVIVGPCSIDHVEAAKDYARRLRPIIDATANQLLVLMRTYFEKPRTRMGWKGFLSDPKQDGSYDINAGLYAARELLLSLNTMGVPTATEYLSMYAPAYYADLIAWGCIGARTVQSQPHRELASSLACPLGFKNGTDGNIRVAIDAMCSAAVAHNCFALAPDGRPILHATSGNKDGHLILRGGRQPNYTTSHVDAAVKALADCGLHTPLMIDCSHANSRGQPKQQLEVVDDVIRQLASGKHSILGVMLESYLIEGSQSLDDSRDRIYGQSITDPCLGWEETAKVLEKLATCTVNHRPLVR